jgi:N-acetylglucosaminyldiphosphoundecaprenol N-acetyl-beta-D-mannosaminyltransferase
MQRNSFCLRRFQTLVYSYETKEYMNKDAFNTVTVLGFKVFSDNLKKIPIKSEKCRVINCSISPNNYGLTTKDPEFKKVLQNTDFLVLDGVYFALASIFLLGKNIKKNQGPDVYKHFINRLNECSGRAFFLGSSEEVLTRIKNRIKVEYPNVSVGTYSPPFKKVFSEEDNAEMVKAINEFQPDIVFVGMTAPKQEKWSLQHRDKVKAGLMISIGNVFDWYAGTQKAIHPFFFKIRMAWLVRIFLRPEIFKRNIGNQMLFFWHLLLILLKFKKSYG